MNFLKITINKFTLLLRSFIYYLSYCIPVNKTIWVFGAWFGKRYSDNSKYLFEYVNENYPSIRAVWLTKNKNTLETIRKKGYEVYLTNSIKGLWLSLTCKVAVFGHSEISDLNPVVQNNKTKLIQLWHGIPLKKIGHDSWPTFSDNSTNQFFIKFKSIIKQLFFPFMLNDYAIVIATSEEIKRNLSSALSVSSDRIKITGYPRNDRLFASKSRDCENKTFKGVYAPTFREKKFDLFERYGFNIEKIDKVLSKHNICLYIKLHPINIISERFLTQLKSSKNLFIFEEDDIYEYLGGFDFLITDYSSIYFDYLLLNRPIIFAPFDLEEYQKNEREFYYDYNDFTPGPKARSWDEVLHYIEESIAYPEKYDCEREKIRKIVHKHCDEYSWKEYTKK